jgi:predicted DNA-binding transcriptional regulator AlpA
MASLDELPPEIANKRALNIHATAEFVGLSVSGWRKLVRRKAAPQPLKITPQKFVWQVGDLVAWLETKREHAEAA